MSKEKELKITEEKNLAVAPVKTELPVTTKKMAIEEIVEEKVLTKQEDKLAKGKRLAEEARKRDSRLVKGIFRNHETPGGNLTFSYLAYKGDSLAKYTLVDEEVCSLPIGVANHLNDDCCYNVHTHTLDIKGLPAVGIGRKVRRFSFSPIDFLDQSEVEAPMARTLLSTP